MGVEGTTEQAIEVGRLGEEFSISDLESAAERVGQCGSMEQFEAALRGSFAPVSRTLADPESASPPTLSVGVNTLEALMNWSEPLEGVPAAAVRRSLRYHMNVNKRHWFRDNMNEAFLRRHVLELIAETPLAFENVVPNTGKSVFTDFKKLAEQEMLEKFRPTCSGCKGAGEVVATGPVKGMKPCPACHEAKLLIFNRIALGK